MKLNAADFECLCDGTRDAITSLVSCRSNEIANEALLLRNSLNDLCAADLARKNDRLTLRRRDLIARANRLLADRQAVAA